MHNREQQTSSLLEGGREEPLASGGATSLDLDVRTRYWNNYLGNLDPCIVPSGEIRSASATTKDLRCTEMAMKPETAQALFTWSRTNNTSALSAVQAIWLVMLMTYLRTDHVCCRYKIYDTKKGNRHHSSICAAALADEDQLSDVLGRLESDLESHRDLPVPKSIFDRYFNTGEERLCNTAVCWLDELSPEKRVEESTAESDDDLLLTVAHRDSALMIRLQWNIAVGSWMASNILHHFAHTLEFAMTHPSCLLQDLPTCSPRDIQFIRDCNRKEPQDANACIHELFQRRVQLHPDIVAIDAHDGSFTYQELDDVTGQLAFVLAHDMELSREERVLLCLPKSKWMGVAMLSVMKAGAAFVPLDINTPPGRVQVVARKSDARFIITDEEHATTYEALGLHVIVLNQSFVTDNTSPARANWTRPDTSPSHLAYVLFTSGSTGEPKGCAVEHKAFASSALAHGPRIGIHAESRVLQFSSHSFGASLTESLTSLMLGACVCVPSDDDRNGNLAQVAAQMRITWACLTPSLVLRANLETVSSLKTLFVGGELLTSAIRDVWAPRVDLIQGYGQSESATICQATPPLTTMSNPKNIGRPTGNRNWLVNPSNHDQLAPAGSIGELVVEGPILAREYLGDVQKTKDAFIKNPKWTNLPELRSEEPNRRMYKTGDLARQFEDGSVEFLGRKDMQVKIRGQRVELGDIESHLKSLVDVTVAAELGVPKGEDKLDTVLVAFLCLGPDAAEAQGQLETVHAPTQARLLDLLAGVEAKLAERLASYMVPTAYVPLAALPLTVTGKTSRLKLRQLIASLSKNELLAWRGGAKAGGAQLRRSHTILYPWWIGNPW